MKSLLKLMILVLLAPAPAMAQGFLDITPSNTWTKVQSGETDQWSVIRMDDPSTRIDLVSYEEKGIRTTYFLIRTMCSNGKAENYVLKPGNRLGLGINCGGDRVSFTPTVIQNLPPLPADAEALIKH